MRQKIDSKKKTKYFLSGFKQFITRGNILDLAIAVIVGGAFGKIIASLVNDILMPLITTLTGKANFTDLIWILNGAEIRYGQFLQNTLEFFIIAFSIYLVINLIIRRQAFIEKMEKEESKEEPKPVAIPEDIKLLTEIKDELVKWNAKKETSNE